MSIRRFARGSLFAGLTLVLAAALAWAPPALAEVRDRVDETFELSADGRVELSNLNGDIEIRTWDRREVRFEAEKVADSQRELDDIDLEFDAASDYLEIEVKHRGRWERHDWRRGRRPGRVDIELTVPRDAHLEISSVNGDVRVDGTRRHTEISLVNGEITARNLTGSIDLSTVNGEIDAVFTRLDAVQDVDLSTVNGEVLLSLPRDADAQLHASTVHGKIHSRLGGVRPRRDRDDWWTRSQSLSLRLGDGRVPFELSTVNGRIELQETGRSGRRG